MIFYFNPFATVGVANDPCCQIRSGHTIFENFTGNFGMCSLEVSHFTYKTFLIHSESFPYHKAFRKWTKKIKWRQERTSIQLMKLQPLFWHLIVKVTTCLVMNQP